MKLYELINTFEKGASFELFRTSKIRHIGYIQKGYRFGESDTIGISADDLTEEDVMGAEVLHIKRSGLVYNCYDITIDIKEDDNTPRVLYTVSCDFSFKTFYKFNDYNSAIACFCEKVISGDFGYIEVKREEHYATYMHSESIKIYHR